MKLKSLHSPWMLPIPGSHRREMSLHAADGWTLELLDNGRVHCRRVEHVDGGTAERDFMLEAWPLAYEVDAGAGMTLVRTLDPARETGVTLETVDIAYGAATEAIKMPPAKRGRGKK